MSVFTFDPDPPRVASPWLRPADPGRKPTPERSSSRDGSVQSGLLSDYGVTKLEAEPQEGPTEYKLHLLLRPRRNYDRMSTSTRISGSMQSRPPLDPAVSKFSVPTTGTSSPSNTTRQDRLEHLTTQLLWRLQQSCPYHANSAALELVVPQLPNDDVPLTEPATLAKLWPGLEESRGALYEIGVADDGTLIGLTKDELDESLRTLRIMAASLGCNMEMLRMVAVGDCEWHEGSDDFGTDAGSAKLFSKAKAHHAKLWVAEVLVTPDLGSREAGQETDGMKYRQSPHPTEALPAPKLGPLTMNQLRVTLTGPTTSGKSTLLGTLTTGTLDNGRGKSRLSLLKHRHEVVSGVTSSITQELIGYSDEGTFNYAHHGIESWINIHDFTKHGRLVHLLDSAGHPRYRRTILRGIVGWAPHWTLVCIPGNASETSTQAGAVPYASDSLGLSDPSVDMSGAYLDLCLQLRIPLVIVITKFDLANRSSMQQSIGKVLTSIKKAGRTPKLLPSSPMVNSDTTHVTAKDSSAVQDVINRLTETDDVLSIVPIVLTSAVKGNGVGLLHVLLQRLPLPRAPTSHDYIGGALNPEQPACLFHIEDRYSLPASYSLVTSGADEQTDVGTVVAGYLRFGHLSIGDTVVIGPFPPDDDDVRGLTPEGQPSLGGYGLSISHPSSTELSRIAMRNAVSASVIKGEWHNAKIVSIRNLRLPVQTLQAGQVGSIGIVFDLPKQDDIDDTFEAAPRTMPRLRKGMVLAIPSRHMLDTGISLQAASGLTAVFENPEAFSLSEGSLVNVYIASVRAAARVVRVSRVAVRSDGSGMATEDIVDVFNLNEELDACERKSGSTTPSRVEVRLELLTNREWIELGSRIVVLDGGSRDKSGLGGFVGSVEEIVD